MLSAVHGAYKKVSEYVKPPLAQSQFKEKGVLTAEEFLQAGDYLVSTCPTWSWEAGDARKAWAHLPPGKQYLITRNVPCMRRASAMEDYSSTVPDSEAPEVEKDGEVGGWVETDAAAADAAAGINADGFEMLPAVTRAPDQVLNIGEEEEGEAGSADVQDEDIPDISDLNLAGPDAGGPTDVPVPPVSPPAPAATVNAAHATEHAGGLRTRTYDLLVTYDQYYYVPRVWLIGYREDGTPLSNDEILEDVFGDYHTHRSRHTVTVEKHPHRSGGGHVLSIHPCRHAEVMHRLSSSVAAEGEDFRVDHYMVLFLKFISSVVPTIEYDFTMSAGGM